MPSETTIREPRTEEEMAALRRVFLDELERTRVDPTFAGLEEEVGTLPGLYAPPLGALLLAVDGDGTVVGAGAMRPLPGPGDCNLTGVIVSVDARGGGIGRRLALGLIECARAAGHRRMHLDLTDASPWAQAMWQALGFVPAPPYFPNPRPGTLHLVRDLTMPE